MPDFFSPNGNTLKVELTGSYDAGITSEVDKQIRHLKIVENALFDKAAALKNSTGSPNFELVSQTHPETQRPRVYVVPKNFRGIHEELADAVLLKAALGMSGK